MLYMVTFTINIPHVSIYTSTMDPMGTDCLGILFAVRLWWVRKRKPLALPMQARNGVLGVSSDCHRTSSLSVGPGTNGWFSWLTCFDGASNHCLSPTIPTVFCTPLGRYDLSHCVHPLCHHLAGLASSKQWEKLTTNAFSTTLNKTISINFLKKRRTVICERCCADLFFFDVVHCLFCAFCKGNLLNSLRCLAQSWNQFTKKGLGSRTGKGMQRKTEVHCRKRFGTEVLPLTLLLYIPLSSCLSQLTLH